MNGSQVLREGRRNEREAREAHACVSHHLVVVIVCLATCTMMVGLNHGWNLLPVCFADMTAMTWPGQFNFDFMTFLAPHLLHARATARGDVKVLPPGESRARA